MRTIGLWIVILGILFPVIGFSQDTGGVNESEKINQLDENSMKTGFWDERSGELTTRGNYLHGLKDNTWETYLSGNVLFRVETYEKGQRNGLTLQFDRQGKITNVEHYKNNKPDGLYLIYGPHSYIVTKEQHFDNGMLTGLNRTFYNTGKIQEEAYYKNDLKNGIARWFNPEGKLVASYYYQNGQFEGSNKTYYDNDTIATVIFYKNNLPDGTFKEFYRNGKPKIIGDYLNGNKEGTWIEYDETGTPVGKKRYKNGIEK